MSAVQDFSITEEHDAQEWERQWWGSCLGTFGEEAKQLTYAHRMGLVNIPLDGKWPVYDLGGKSVLDVGGGPVSMLLKTHNRGRCVVLDPCRFPAWVTARYEHAGVEQAREPAESYESLDPFDEAWIYNCLQHTESPETIIGMVREHATTLRIFEWIETETNVGHPHTLHAEELDRWIGGTGTIGFVDENGAVGLAYWGVMTL